MNALFKCMFITLALILTVSVFAPGHARGVPLPVTVTFSVNIAPGGSGTSANTANIEYRNGNNAVSYAHPSPGNPVTVSAFPGSEYRYSGSLTGSNSTHRWWCNQSWIGTIPFEDTASISRTYYEQYKPSFLFYGTEATRTISLESRFYFGQSMLESGIYGQWSGWCDKGSRLIFSQYTTGWPQGRTPQARSFLVNSDFQTDIPYVVPSIPVTFAAFTVHGTSSSANKATVTYWSSYGFPSTVAVGKNSSQTVYAAAGLEYSYSPELSGSDSCRRWRSNDTLTGTVPLSGYAVISRNYTEQRNANVSLPGTDADHTVSTLARQYFGQQLTESGIHTAWSGWCDILSTLTFSQSTTGAPPLYTTVTRSWLINDCINPTISYPGPSIPVTFAAVMEHGSCESDSQATVSYLGPDGAPRTAHPRPGQSVSVAAKPGSDYSYSPDLAGSDSCRRWWCDEALTGSLPDSGSAVVKRFYTEQFKPNVALLGTDASHTVQTEARWSLGQLVTESGIHGAWSDWCDAGSQLVFSHVTSGSPAKTTTGSRSWTVGSCLTQSIRYYGPSIPITFAAILTRGSSPDDNEATVNYNNPDGDLMTVHPSPGKAITVAAQPGSDYAFSSTLSGSGSSRRWLCYQTLTGALPPSGYTVVSRNYIEQFRPTITLDGADAAHTASTEERLFCESQLTESGIANTWSDWCDSNSRLVFSQSTTGSPARSTTSARAWKITSPLNATIEYYGPSIPVTFAASLRIGSATLTNTAEVLYTDPKGDWRVAHPAIGQSVSVAAMPGGAYIYAPTLAGSNLTCHRWYCNDVLSGTFPISGATSTARLYWEQWKPVITIDAYQEYLELHIDKHVQFGVDVAPISPPFPMPSVWSMWTDHNSQLIFGRTSTWPLYWTNHTRAWIVRDCIKATIPYTTW